MQSNVIDAVNLGASAAQMNFSVWALFMRADWLVKTVLFLLLLASVWSWAIIFEKVMGLRKLNRLAAAFEQRFWSGQPLDSLYDKVGAHPEDPMSAVFSSGMREWRRALEKGKGDARLSASLSERIDRVMQITVSREMSRIERYMTFLASTGSTAPFVGLFGTVWGIMNSFQSIALTKNTSLAVVAPGIAEALFATALGLLAAIPAVLAYNKLSSDLDRYGARLDGFAVEFGAILSRQMEEKA
ncbi:protein TolQ [Varunaivibrio sulfuroxidans]|uniref:Tol-Pal system protein TolQ n=1 Tax=Varunaivibrio sulfuroxidans TaxID=1773489 RepID=A0A4R3JAW4_9PROT|nr:protein TolQ [Varunaivibrio sulfuroxidans]TCS63149.1 cell division and transport-associated protein TolQ [Varunaivibrio sulfuroxidans]WES31786.1 protein TolQ [Varunaivibrio sulfuroxidans]